MPRKPRRQVKFVSATDFLMLAGRKPPPQVAAGASSRADRLGGAHIGDERADHPGAHRADDRDRLLGAAGHPDHQRGRAQLLGRGGDHPRLRPPIRSAAPLGVEIVADHVADGVDQRLLARASRRWPPASSWRAAGRRRRSPRRSGPTAPRCGDRRVGEKGCAGRGRGQIGRVDEMRRAAELRRRPAGRIR